MVLEGPDGVGKTTLVQEVAERLVSASKSARVFSFPGKDPGTLGELVYRLHHDPKAYGLTQLTPTSLQAMHIAAHMDAIESKLLPSLAQVQVVLLDRYWWSTYVYGLLGGVSKPILKSLLEAERASWQDLLPSVVFLLDRERPFRQEMSSQSWQAVRRLYKDLAKSECANHEVVTIRIDDSVGHIAKKLAFLIESRL